MVKIIPMSRRQIITAAVAVLVILGSVISMVGRSGYRPSRAEFEQQLALGTVMAEETARLLADHGRVVLVAMQPGPDGRGFASEHVKRFQRALAAHRGVVVVATVYVLPNPAPIESDIHASAFSPMSPSAKQFVEVLTKHPKVDALVFFTFPPGLGGMPGPEGRDGAPRIIWQREPTSQAQDASDQEQQ